MEISSFPQGAKSTWGIRYVDKPYKRKGTLYVPKRCTEYWRCSQQGEPQLHASSRKRTVVFEIARKGGTGFQ